MSSENVTIESVLEKIETLMRFMPEKGSEKLYALEQLALQPTVQAKILANQALASLELQRHLIGVLHELALVVRRL